MSRRNRSPKSMPGPRGWLSMILLVAIAAAGAWFQRAPPIGGQAQVIDGDSVVIGGIEMRLKGIDAPEGRQSCEREGRLWACGEAARRELQRLMTGREVSCSDHGKDQHDRRLATCHAGGTNVNEAMVRAGYALAYGAYERAEREARQLKRGLWSGTFERPRDWRDKHMR